MHRTITARRIVAVAGAVLLLISMAACGSSDSSSSGTTTSTTSSKGGTSATTGGGGANGGGTDGGTSGGPSTSSGGGSGDPSGSGATTEPENADGPGGGGPCVPNADRLSGTSTVMWTADSASKHKDSDATVATTMLFQQDGSLEPVALDVKVGEVFTFGLADGVSDIVSAKVGCDGGQTVLTGKPLAAEYITTPGTYDVVNVVADKLVGTITVK